MFVELPPWWARDLSPAFAAGVSLEGAQAAFGEHQGLVHKPKRLCEVLIEEGRAAATSDVGFYRGR